MKPRPWSLLAGPIAAVVLLASCGGGGPSTQVYRSDDGLVFNVPPDVAPSNPASTVAGPRLLVGPAMQLTYHYAAGAAQPSSAGKDARVSLLSIDGHNAYSEYYTDADDTTGLRYVAFLYVEDAGGGRALSMVVRSATEDGLDTAKKIFRSVEFEDAAMAANAS